MPIDDASLKPNAPDAPAQNPTGPLVFAESKSKLALLLLASIIFVAGGVAMVLHPRPYHADAAMGISGVLFFGSLIPVLVTRLLNRRPMAVVTPDGLACPALFDGQVAWSHIQKCETKGFRKSKSLVFNADAEALNALAWRAPYRWFRRFSASTSPIYVPLSTMDGDADQFTALCVAHVASGKSARLRNPALAQLQAQTDVEEARRTAAAERLKASVGFPIVTSGLIVVLACVFALELLLPASPARNQLTPSIPTLVKFGGLYRETVQKGQWIPIFTAPLLHLSLAHLLANCIALLIVGFRFERIVGSAWFAAIFAVSAVCGSLMSLAINPPTVVSVGASGGIVGLFTAAAIGAFHFPSGPIRTLLLITAFQTLLPSLIPLATAPGGVHIDYACHFGGAVGGALMGAMLLRLWPEDQARPAWTNPATIVGALFFLAGLYPFTMLNFKKVPTSLGYATPQKAEETDDEADISLTAAELVNDVEYACKVAKEKAQQAALDALRSKGSYAAVHSARLNLQDELRDAPEQTCRELLSPGVQPQGADASASPGHAPTQGAVETDDEADLSLTAAELADDVEYACKAPKEKAKQAALDALRSKGSYAAVHSARLNLQNELRDAPEQTCHELLSPGVQPQGADASASPGHAPTQGAEETDDEADLSLTAAELADDVEYACKAPKEKAKQAALDALRSKGSYTAVHSARLNLQNELRDAPEQTCHELLPPGVQPQSDNLDASARPGNAPTQKNEETDVQQCDALAASPDDLGRPKGVAGVTFDQVNAKAAEAPCRAALAAFPKAPRLQYELGRILASKQDYTEAAEWYGKAADQGYAVAQNNLGVLYSYGQGVAQDYPQAAAWYRKAADQGYAGAEYNLAVLYRGGNGVSKDVTQALKWYRKAADQGNAYAKKALERLGEK